MSLAHELRTAHRERLARLYSLTRYPSDRNGCSAPRPELQWPVVGNIKSHHIMGAVVHVTNIGKGDIVSPSRFARIVFARHVVFYLCRKHTNLSLAEIGRRCGKRDHSTVHHGCKKVVDSGDSYASVIAAVENLLFCGQGKD